MIVSRIGLREEFSMRVRNIWILLLALLLPVFGSAFNFGGGGPTLIYSQFDFSEINARLELQSFPVFKDGAIGFGGKGYGMLGRNFVIGGEGYDLVLKETIGGKSSSILIEAGGCYLGKQITITDRFGIRLGGTLGNYDKTVILHEITNDPINNREYSILKQTSYWVKPQIDLEFKILPIVSIEVGIGKSFSFGKKGHDLDLIKASSMPELSFLLGFGF